MKTKKLDNTEVTVNLLFLSYLTAAKSLAPAKSVGRFVNSYDLDIVFLKAA